MDKLIAEEVSLDMIPAHVVVRKPLGRSGELFARLLAMDPSKAMKVQNRDAHHVGSTQRQMREKAKAIGRELDYLRDGTDLYLFWKVKSAA